MKIKSLLSVIACGIVSQVMVGCNSSKQYFDFTVPTASHQKMAPASESSVLAQSTSENTALVETMAVDAPATKQVEANPQEMALEANAAPATASTNVTRTAPLTTAAVATATKATAIEKAENSKKAKKVLTKMTSKLKKDVKNVNKINALNNYVKIGIVLILAGVLISILPKLGLLGSIVALIGVIILVLGLLEML